jgi:hypothetical protein
MLRLWQPRWIDFRSLGNDLRVALQDQQAKVLLIAGDPVPYLDWAHRLPNRVVVTFPWPFSAKSKRQMPTWPSKFEIVIADLSEDDIRAKVSVNSIGQLVAPGGKLFVVIVNRRRAKHHSGFTDAIIGNLDLLQAANANHVEARFVRGNALRRTTERLMETMLRSSIRHPETSSLAALGCLALIPAMVILNLVEVAVARGRGGRQKWSSVFLEFAAPEVSDD